MALVEQLIGFSGFVEVFTGLNLALSIRKVKKEITTWVRIGFMGKIPESHLDLAQSNMQGASALQKDPEVVRGIARIEELAKEGERLIDRAFDNPLSRHAYLAAGLYGLVLLFVSGAGQAAGVIRLAALDTMVVVNAALLVIYLGVLCAASWGRSPRQLSVLLEAPVALVVGAVIVVALELLWIYALPQVCRTYTGLVAVLLLCLPYPLVFAVAYHALHKDLRQIAQKVEPIRATIRRKYSAALGKLTPRGLVKP